MVDSVFFIKEYFRVYEDCWILLVFTLFPEPLVLFTGLCLTQISLSPDVSFKLLILNLYAHGLNTAQAMSNLCSGSQL